MTMPVMDSASEGLMSSVARAAAKRSRFEPLMMDWIGAAATLPR